MKQRPNLVALVVLTWVVAVGWPMHVSRAAMDDGGDALRDLIARTQPAFVFLSGGSGVLISADGLMVSNAHVIGKGREFTVRIGDGRSFKAKVLGLHSFGDLALLQIEGAKDLPFVKLGDSDAMRVGEFCMAIGNPLALGMLDQTATVSVGVISAVRHLHGRYADSLVTDAPINPGNSGGPLLNAQGELIGVNGQIRTRMGLKSNAGLGFAIPSNRIKLWLPVLQKAKGREVGHGRLEGIEWETEGIMTQLSYAAPTIRRVEPNSDAARAGFKEGDKVLKCQGEDVRTATQVLLILAMYPTTETLQVVVERDGRKQTLMFKLDPIPVEN
jgi:serine protease Do